MNQNHIYCNSITLFQKTFDMKITSCSVIVPQSNLKIAFCSVFKLLLLKPPLWSHGFFFIFEASSIVLHGLWKKTHMTFFSTWNITPQSWKNTQKQKWLKASKCCKSAIMNFQTPKFLEFALLNNHYQISKMTEIKISNYQHLLGSFRN